MISLYIAFVTGTPTEGYAATFPDLPECTTRGANPTDLLLLARELIAAKLASMSKAGRQWPKPTQLEQIDRPPGSFLIMVDVAQDDVVVRINLSIGEQLLKRVDEAAEARGMSRSGFFAHSVRISLGERGEAGFGGQYPLPAQAE
jgi:predicted RNase H-like HicB family nuclease